MTPIKKKLSTILELLGGEPALLEITLKEALDFVEEYTENASIKANIIAKSYQLRQLKKRDRFDLASFNALKKELVTLLEAVPQHSLSTDGAKRDIDIVCLEGIEKSYQTHSFTLKNINLNIPLSQITGIIGANANGKSTLIKIMVGELLPNKGMIHFPFFQKSKAKLNWKSLKKQIAYISQELPEWKGTLRDNLHLETTLHDITGAENILRVDFILERLGLTEYVDCAWNELSGGYKLRFALAKALVWKPSFLVLDEPLANLDMASQMIVLQDLKELVKSQRFPLSVVITSQHIHEIEQIADKLVVLEQGAIVYQGEPRSFKQDSKNLIFEFACDLELHSMQTILAKSPLISLRKQGKYYIVQYDKTAFSTEQFFNLMTQNQVSLGYFRDITHSVKQLFLNI